MLALRSYPNDQSKALRAEPKSLARHHGPERSPNVKERHCIPSPNDHLPSIAAAQSAAQTIKARASVLGVLFAGAHAVTMDGSAELESSLGLATTVWYEV